MNQPNNRRSNNRRADVAAQAKAKELGQADVRGGAKPRPDTMVRNRL